MNITSNQLDKKKIDEINNPAFNGGLINLISIKGKPGDLTFHQNILQAKKSINNMFRADSFFAALFKYGKNKKKSKKNASVSYRKFKKLNPTIISLMKTSNSTKQKKNKKGIVKKFDMDINNNITTNNEKNSNKNISNLYIKSSSKKESPEKNKKIISNNLKKYVMQTPNRNIKFNINNNNLNNLNNNKLIKNFSLPQLKVKGSSNISDRNNANIKEIASFDKSDTNKKFNLFELTSKHEVYNNKKKLKKIEIKKPEIKIINSTDTPLETGTITSSMTSNFMKYNTISNYHHHDKKGLDLSKSKNIQNLIMSTDSLTGTDKLNLFKTLSTGDNFNNNSPSHIDILNILINKCKLEINNGNLINRNVSVYSREVDEKFDKIKKRKKIKINNQNEEVEFLKGEKKGQNKYDILKKEYIEKSKGKLNLKVSDELVFRNKKVFEKYINNIANQDPYELFSHDLDKIINDNQLKRDKEFKEYETIEKILDESNKQKELLKIQIDNNLLKSKKDKEDCFKTVKNNNKYKKFNENYGFTLGKPNFESRFAHNMGANSFSSILAKNVKIAEN